MMHTWLPKALAVPGNMYYIILYLAVLTPNKITTMRNSSLNKMSFTDYVLVIKKFLVSNYKKSLKFARTRIRKLTISF